MTGREPLVRKGFIDFLKRISKIEKLKEICLTNNGVLLKEFAAEIKDGEICRINVSLDTLKADRFFHITGRDYFDRVWEGIQEVEHLGFNPIKINLLALRGFNDDEIVDFGRLTLRKPYHILFSEFMPVGKKNSWGSKRFISAKEIYNHIQSLADLKPIRPHPFDGPAQRFVLDGGKGEIGFIGALSQHFCEVCNRLRLTAEGHLRSCLFSDQETDIKTPLRDGKENSYLWELIRLAIENRPNNHQQISQRPQKCVRQMSSIGG